MINDTCKDEPLKTCMIICYIFFFIWKQTTVKQTKQAHWAYKINVQTRNKGEDTKQYKTLKSRDANTSKGIHTLTFQQTNSCICHETFKNTHIDTWICTQSFVVCTFVHIKMFVLKMLCFVKNKTPRNVCKCEKQHISNKSARFAKKICHVQKCNKTANCWSKQTKQR